MRVIKRYTNRKLYDTEDKRYVTLDQVARLIQEGEEVRVVDNETGDDLTNVTLSQILVEQEKRQEGSVPRTLLSQFIKGGTSTVDFFRRTISGFFGDAIIPEETVRENVEKMVEQGQISAEEARELESDLLDKTREAWHDLEARIEERVGGILSRLRIPHKSDIEDLHARLDALADKYDRLVEAFEEEDAAATEAGETEEAETA